MTVLHNPSYVRFEETAFCLLMVDLVAFFV